MCTFAHLLIPFFMQCARFAMSTLCTLRYYLTHCAHCAHFCFSHCFLFFSGPCWFRKGSNKLLLAARRSDETGRRRTAGNIADGLLCCLWRRVEKPEKMTHCLSRGGYNCRGYIALLHPNDLASRQLEYLAQHTLLAFLGKTICTIRVLLQAVQEHSQ